VEQEGTYPLPEAQTDRFLFKLLVDYPQEHEEREMMDRWGKVTSEPELSAVSSGEELLALRAQVEQVHVSEELKAYMLALVRASRELSSLPENSTTPPLLSFGASPRASVSDPSQPRAGLDARPGFCHTRDGTGRFL